MSEEKIIHNILGKTGGRNNVVYAPPITGYNPKISLEYDLSGNVTRIKEEFHGQILIQDLTWIGDVLTNITEQKLMT